MIEQNVDLGDRSYPIYIGAGAIDLVGKTVAALGATRVLIVTNTTVGPLYIVRVKDSLQRHCPDIPVSCVELPDGECYKDLHHVGRILDAAVNAKLDRKSVMIALGGGVIGDMTGFAASMWMRGIRFVQIPTTLLAQVDSSVGGKTGVNLPAGKNLIGAFHQPKAVLIDPEVLKTLPEREVSAGIAEIIKYGFLGDAEFIAMLEQEMPRLRALDECVVSRVVAHCCCMKAEIVKADEQENGVRAKLNLGHTFGHAIEKLTGYSVWLHGEAVAIGTVMAATLSERLGYLAKEDVERVRCLVVASGLPTHVDGLDADAAYQVMCGDKKSVGGVIRFILMRGIGNTTIEPVSEDKVRETMLLSGWS